MEEHQYSREFPPRLRCVGVLPATTTRRYDDVLRLVATPTTETGLFPGQEESGPCPEDRRRATPARVQAHVHRRGKAASLRERRLRRETSPFRATTKPRDRHETTGSFRASAVPRDRHETISLQVEADPFIKKCSLRRYQWLREWQLSRPTSQGTVPVRIIIIIKWRLPSLQGCRWQRRLLLKPPYRQLKVRQDLNGPLLGGLAVSALTRRDPPLRTVPKRSRCLQGTLANRLAKRT